jgi:CelD/BcsL family acetyltransferase involved in cellulose biosynthesis
VPVYEINPLQDARWHDLVQRDERSSIFHSTGWLEALRQTYGYEPVVFTTCPDGQALTNGIVFCGVNSWLTGRRLVSLPFSDHCEPLVNEPHEFEEITSFLQEEVKKRRLKYIELRPLSSLASPPPGASESDSFCLHRVDLRLRADELYQKLHNASIRQKVKRSEREGLSYEVGTSRTFLEQFYRLFVVTRRRHGLPPSPLCWFENLIKCLGSNVQIRITSKEGRPTAGILTLTHKDVIVYKYGCSDMSLSNLGGTPLLFWMTMKESQAAGLRELDLGRSDLDNEGLITFKNRLGGVRSVLTYWLWPMEAGRHSQNSWKSRIAKRMLANAPSAVRIGAGNLLYKHMG